MVFNIGVIHLATPLRIHTHPRDDPSHIDNPYRTRTAQNLPNTIHRELRMTLRQVFPGPCPRPVVVHQDPLRQLRDHRPSLGRPQPSYAVPRAPQLSLQHSRELFQDLVVFVVAIVVIGGR
jgi:hypothetical protein